MGDHQSVQRTMKTSSTAEKGNLSTQQALLNNKQGNLCCKCVCWILSLFIIILVILGFSILILYLVFHPKLPEYRIDSLRVSDLRVNYDFTLYVEFNVNITVRNPNEKIGIYYKKGGQLGVWYRKTKLCEGPIPRFYQGHRNVTKLDVVLTGNAEYGNTLMSALQQQQQTRHVPLDLKVDAPVAVKLGGLKLRKVRISADCMLMVDNLSANYKSSIKARNCSFRLML